MGKDWKSFNSAKYQENKPKPSQKKSLVKPVCSAVAGTSVYTHLDRKMKIPFWKHTDWAFNGAVTRICQRLKVCRVVELEGYLGLFYVALT